MSNNDSALRTVFIVDSHDTFRQHLNGEKKLGLNQLRKGEPYFIQIRTKANHQIKYEFFGIFDKKTKTNIYLRNIFYYHPSDLVVNHYGYNLTLHKGHRYELEREINKKRNKYTCQYKKPISKPIKTKKIWGHIYHNCISDPNSSIDIRITDPEYHVSIYSVPSQLILENKNGYVHDWNNGVRTSDGLTKTNKKRIFYIDEPQQKKQFETKGPAVSIKDNTLYYVVIKDKLSFLCKTTTVHDSFVKIKDVCFFQKGRFKADTETQKKMYYFSKNERIETNEINEHKEFEEYFIFGEQNRFESEFIGITDEMEIKYKNLVHTGSEITLPLNNNVSFYPVGINSLQVIDKYGREICTIGSS
jgi:hypothetical protein